MSRIGNRILEIPTGITVNIEPNLVKVSNSSNNHLTVDYDSNLLLVENQENKILVKRKNEEKQTKMLHGTINANISNALIGLSQGHQKDLKITGVGYKAAVVNDSIDLYLGHSHNIKIKINQGLQVTCKTPTEISIKGYDKAEVGQLAAVIRSKRPPEPYKGKGVMYVNEHIIRKAGKTADKK